MNIDFIAQMFCVFCAFPVVSSFLIHGVIKLEASKCLR